MTKEEPYFGDEQNNWSPNDEIDPDLLEPEYDEDLEKYLAERDATSYQLDSKEEAPY